MWNACKPNLVGIVFLVAEILLLLLSFENGQISLSEHGPWGSKNRIGSKNSEIDEIYVCTKFGGPGLSDYFCISSIK